MKLPKSKMRTPGIPKVVRHLALMLGVALAATPASADPVLDMVGAAITPMPFSAKIVSTGTDAVYFNPTLMLDQKPGFRIGFFYVRHNLNIGYMDRPADADISLDAYSSRPIDETPLPSDRMRPTPTSALVNKRGAHNPIDNTYYMNISHSAHFIKDKLAFGVYMLIPTNSFQSQRPFFADEREQIFSNSLHFELFGDRMRNYLFSMSIAGRPAKWVSLGIGLTLSMVSHTTSRVLVTGIGTGSAPVISPEVSVRAVAVPYAAVTFAPIEGLKIATTFHWKSQSPMKTSHQQQIWGYDKSGEPYMTENTYDFTYSSDPMRLALGASWTGKGTDRLDYTVAATFTWARWSDYRDRQADKPSKAWSDNFPVTAGVLFSVDKAHEIGLDMTFVKSPVPYQDGRTNYIDNDRFGIATGYGYKFLVKKKYLLSFGVSYQFQHLIPRTTLKSSSAANPVVDEFADSIFYGSDEPVASSDGLQTNNPGFPGFSSSGWLMAAGLYFRFQH